VPVDRAIQNSDSPSPAKKKLIFAAGQEFARPDCGKHSAPGKKDRKKRICDAVIRPWNDIPYISRVGCGNDRNSSALVRSRALVTSGGTGYKNSESRVFTGLSTRCMWKASDKMHRIIQEAFAEIARPEFAPTKPNH